MVARRSFTRTHQHNTFATNSMIMERTNGPTRSPQANCSTLPDPQDGPHSSVQGDRSAPGMDLAPDQPFPTFMSGPPGTTTQEVNSHAGEPPQVRAQQPDYPRPQRSDDRLRLIVILE
jgi:hypothetical protein